MGRPPMGEVGQDRDALAFSVPDDPVRVGCGQVVDTARQGGEIHSSFPAGSVTTCTFTPCRRYLNGIRNHWPPALTHHTHIELLAYRD